MSPAIAEMSSSSTSSSPRISHQNPPTKHHRESKGRPSWTRRVKSSLFYGSESRDKPGLNGRGEHGPPDPASPNRSYLLKLRGRKRKGKKGGIGEAGQINSRETTSDVETVRRLKDETLFDTYNPPNITASSWADQNGHKRTVSRDDYLTARGANPRTGVISPSITTCSSHSDTSGSLEELVDQKDQKKNKKWRLKGDQWISLDRNEETPLPSPGAGNLDADRVVNIEDRARSYVRRLHQSGVPHSQVEDRFVVNMPSAREPCPPTMTTQQIWEFQKAIDKIYKNGETFPDHNPPLEPVRNSSGTPPKSLSSRDYSKDRLGGVTGHAARCASIQEPIDITRHPALPSEQRHFLGSIGAKGAERRKSGDLAAPSSRMMTATSLKGWRNQEASSAKNNIQMGGVEPAQGLHSRMCSSGLLDWRDHKSLTILCPKASFQEAASTITTTMTNITPHMTGLHGAITSPNQKGDPNPAEKTELRSASAYLSSQKKPAEGPAAAGYQNHTVITRNPVDQAKGMGTDGPIPRAAVCSRDITSYSMHCACACASFCLRMILHCIMNILLSCFQISLETCEHFLSNPKHLEGKTVAKEVLSNARYQCTSFITLALVAYVTSRFICIFIFGLQNSWVVKLIMQDGGCPSPTEVP
ncbi:uncharacterized protein CIMG_08201 [Coccidioides immitis RS]|uniref:Uncharacterized protein n=1 Tax=Coccidioides immitis (strain RS) TaxID=246410 RepID=J3K514_COCIM|nr:uncharacterized protein CIMG_08201 [Coccidioides immitis RS]EAS29455.3 hypothetical protein CIMG_08201 [Coccidioides immitis RS]